MKISHKFLTIPVILFCLSLNYAIAYSNPHDIYTESQKYTNKEYPNANDLVLKDNTTAEYKEDGTSVSTNEFYIKILTDKGIEDNRVISLNFLLPYYTVEVKELDLIKANGQIIKLDPNELGKVMISTDQMGDNIYNPNSKVLQLSIPNLEVNDIIHTLSKVIQNKPMIPNSWFDASILQLTSPIIETEYSIKSPNSLPLSKETVLSQIKNNLTFNTVKDEDSITRIWQAKNVPQIIPEPNMPSTSKVAQRVLVSTLSDWQTVSKWYWNLCEPKINSINDAMKLKVKELINKDNSDEKNIENIYYFVAQKIRYAGITAETEAPGFEPKASDVTFDTRFGVCRDKAALLVSMLKIAGFNAYPVIIKVGTKLDKEVPIPYFNHAIACVEVGDKTIFMDPTDENSREMFPAYLSNCSYLIAKPNGADLETTPIIPASQNMADIKTNGSIDNNGTLTAQTVITLHGYNDNAYRSYFSRLDKNQIKRFYEQVLSAVISSAKLNSISITPQNMMDTSIPLTIQLSYTADNYIIENNDMGMLQLPWLGQKIGLVNYIIKNTFLKERKYPFVTGIACGYDENIEIKIDDRFINSYILPTYTSTNNILSDYEQSVKTEKNSIQADNLFTINLVEYSPTQYLELKKILQSIEENRKKQIIANLNTEQKNAEDTSQSDLKILDNKITLTLNAEGSWKENYYFKEKILTYNGKKDESELKIEYFPDFENVDIKILKVIEPNGNIQTVSKEFINTMDSSWNASAPRYPQGKILVVNLPGIEIGSEIEIEYTKSVKDMPFFSYMDIMRDFNPIEKYNLTVNYPQNADLKIKIINTDMQMNKPLLIDNKKQSEINLQNIPPLKKESNTPPKWSFLPAVLISSEDLKNYANLFKNEFIKHTINQINTEKTTRNLTENLKSEIEKIIAVRDFISLNIRSAGPTFISMPLSSLSDADVTLKDGYGNNADRAILMYSMLKAAGISTNIIQATEFYNIDEIVKPLIQTPQLEMFSSVLLAAETPKGVIYLNDTDRYAEIGTTSHENMLAMNIDDASFFIIKALKNCETKTENEYKINLSNDGNAIINVKEKLWGNSFAYNNKLFAEMRKEEKSQYFQNIVSSLSQSAEAASTLNTNFEAYPGTIEYSVNIPNFAILDNPYYYFYTPSNLKNLFQAEQQTRNYPYYIDKNEESKMIITTVLPKNYEEMVISPENYNFLIKTSEIDANLNEDSGLLTQTFKIELKPSILSIENYNALVEDNKIMKSKALNSFLLKKTN